MLPYQSVLRKEDGIVIVGLGGAGANILQRFRGSSAENVRLCIMSLDERLGREAGNVEFIQLGAGLNHGLGSGGDPEVGRQAMEESRSEIEALLRNARLLVMVVGLGGGTGSGVAPVLAEMASKAGVFLVSVLVMPFSFEGRRRREQADKALENISAVSDLVFCFENDYMEELFRSRNGAMAVFEEANGLLSQATASIPMLANSPGIINIGLDELVTALRNNDSRCIYGSGTGYGPHRAEDAARAALESPLVAYHNSLRHAHTVIVHIAGGNNMSLSELRTAMETIRKQLGNDEVNFFFGAAVKPRLGEEIRVSLIASLDAGEFRLALEEEAAAAAAAAAAEQQEAAPEPEYAEAEPVEDEEPMAEEEEEESLYADAEEDELPEEPVEEEDGEDIFADEEEVEEEEEPVQRFAPAPRSFSPAPAPRTYTPAPAPAPRSYTPAPAPEPAPRTYTPAPAPTPAPRSAAPATMPGIFDGSGSQGFFNLDGQPVQGTLPKDSEDEYDERVRSLFSDDAAPPMASPQRYSPEASRRRRAADDEDEEREFSTRYNDLRDMFPE